MKVHVFGLLRSIYEFEFEFKSPLILDATSRNKNISILLEHELITREYVTCSTVMFKITELGEEFLELSKL